MNSVLNIDTLTWIDCKDQQPEEDGKYAVKYRILVGGIYSDVQCGVSNYHANDDDDAWYDTTDRNGSHLNEVHIIVAWADIST